jgi:hypothetical protein
MNTGNWLKLCIGSLIAMVVLGITGALVNGLTQGAPASAGIRFAFALPMGIAFLLFVASVPPVAIRFFITAQERIGNAAHPIVDFLRRHERAAVIAVWVLWMTGALVAVPAIIHDIASAP